MKTFVGFVLGMMAVVAGAGEKAPLKVLMIGNSFSICVQKQMPQVAKAMGLKLDLGSLYIGGCSLERHFNNVLASTNAAFRPYRWTRYVDGEARPTASANIPEILSAEDWDVVTLQQASHLSWRPESYRPYADRLVATIRARAPHAEIVLQETWSYTPFDKRLATWGLNPKQMYAKLHAAYGAYAAAQGLRVIPMGTAVERYRAKLPVVYTDHSLGNDVVGRASFARDERGVWRHKGDVFHLGPRGEYLQALVWTAKLFAVDVTACPYAPAFLTAPEAAFLKKIAQETVAGPAS